MTEKLQKNIRLSEDAIAILKILCENNQRSEGQMIEFLIREQAKKDKIPTPKKKP